MAKHFGPITSRDEKLVARNSPYRNKMVKPTFDDFDVDRVIAAEKATFEYCGERQDIGHLMEAAKRLVEDPSSLLLFSVFQTPNLVQDLMILSMLFYRGHSGDAVAHLCTPYDMEAELHLEKEDDWIRLARDLPEDIPPHQWGPIITSDLRMNHLIRDVAFAVESKLNKVLVEQMRELRMDDPENLINMPLAHSMWPEIRRLAQAEIDKLPEGHWHSVLKRSRSPSPDERPTKRTSLK